MVPPLIETVSDGSRESNTTRRHFSPGETTSNLPSPPVAPGRPFTDVYSRRQSEEFTYLPSKFASPAKFGNPFSRVYLQGQCYQPHELRPIDRPQLSKSTSFRRERVNSREKNDPFNSDVEKQRRRRFARRPTAVSIRRRAAARSRRFTQRGVESRDSSRSDYAGAYPSAITRRASRFRAIIAAARATARIVAVKFTRGLSRRRYRVHWSSDLGFVFTSD